MNTLKIIGGILATILLGSFGSGLWERVIDPALDVIFRTAIRLASSFYAGYIDNLYKVAVYETPNFYQAKIAALLLILSGGITIYLLSKGELNWLNTDAENKFMTTFKESLRIGFTLGAMLLLGSGGFLLSRADYLQQVNAYSMRSIEILRPYIGEEAYFQVRSDCFLVTSRDKFIKFNDTLKDYADKHNILLPKFKPL